MSWTIATYDRPDPDVVDFSGDYVNDYAPENLKFTLNKGENGPGDINYEVSRSRDVIGPDFVGPYRTYYRLYNAVDLASADDTDIVMAGPITSLGVTSRDEHAKVGGKTWEHQLERLFWPFDPADESTYRLGIPATTDFEPAPTFAYRHARTTTNLITDLVNFISAQDHAPPIIVDVVALADATQLLEVQLIDTESLLSKIQALSQSDADPFDFWIDPLTRELKIQGPAQYDAADASALPANTEYHFDSDQEDSGIYDISFTNTGPGCNWLLGTGNNVSNEMAAFFQYEDAQIVYGLMQMIQQFSDARGKTFLEKLARRYLLFNTNPIHEITLTVIPDKITNFWQRFKPGIPIWLTADLEAHNLDSGQEIVSIDLDTSNQNNNLVTFKLNQIYEAVTL